MTTVDLGKPADNTLPFLVARANAIEVYTQLEQALAFLFATLLKTDLDVAGIVFFRITNTSARNAIIESLLEKRHAKNFDAYWHGTPNTPDRRGLFSLIRQSDQRRNEIVHWHGVNKIHFEGDQHTTTLALMKPNAWSIPSESPSISVDDMNTFSKKADFAARSITMFTVLVSGHLASTPNEQSIWEEICQRPCSYPPTDGHPLADRKRP